MQNLLLRYYEKILLLMSASFRGDYLQADVSGKISALVENRPFIMLAYGMSLLLADYSRIWQLYGAPIVASQLLFPSPPRNASSENLEQAVDIYLQNVELERAMCASINAACLFVLQPLLFSKQGLGPIEQDALANLEPDGVHFVRSFYQDEHDPLRLRGIPLPGVACV